MLKDCWSEGGGLLATPRPLLQRATNLLFRHEGPQVGIS